jgi:phosphatidylglycerophosphatase A
LKPGSSSFWRRWLPPQAPNLRQIILFFATGAGTGYIPWFPGSAGTLLAIPLSLGLNRIAGVSLPLALLTLAAFFGLATWLCHEAEAILQEKDCRRIVIDEVAGFLLANLFAPPEFKPVASAFILFRFFDIIKIFPAGRAEKISGGLGVILDDLIAGLYALTIVRLLLFWGMI